MDERDPFEPEGLLRAGPYAGHHLDTVKFRSVRLLAPQQAAQFGPANGEQMVANFLHRGRWHLARIPADPVADVIVHLQRVPHSFPGAHAQIRFRLRPERALTLLPQGAHSGAAAGSVDDVVYTVEGNFPPGTSSAPAGGIEQSGIAYMLMSLADKIVAMSEAGTLNRVDQYRLAVSDSEKQAILQRALDIATEAESQRMFNLLRRNCTTEAIRILDGALHYPTWRRALSKLTYSGLPEAMRLYLRERGLLGPDSRLPALADELAQ